MRNLWTALTFVFWCLWRHRNDVVFEGAAPSAVVVKSKLRIEYEAWHRAGLFRGEAFGFPLPTPERWLVGD